MGLRGHVLSSGGPGHRLPLGAAPNHLPGRRLGSACRRARAFYVRLFSKALGL